MIRNVAWQPCLDAWPRPPRADRVIRRASLMIRQPGVFSDCSVPGSLRCSV